MTTLKKVYYLFLFFIFNTLSLLNAQLSMPAFFSDNMVLQRNAPIKIWGQSNPGAIVNISFQGQLYLDITNEDGYWEKTMDASPEGGPYEMIILSEGEQLNFSNIMMGEVWLCAGQSNMERSLKTLTNATNEIESATWPNIRYFNIPDILESTPSKGMMANPWSVCAPETAENYSAVAYFFARNLHLDLNIPIGIIDITWGGTRINTWISLESLSAFPEFAGTLPPQDIDILNADIEQQQIVWEQALETTDLGLQQHWENDITGWRDWPTMLIPKPWEADALANKDGSVWFKKSFTLTAQQAASDASISLGKIDDSDQSWVNGHFVGSLDLHPGTVRQYDVPASFLQVGENIVTVRVRDYGYVGGLLGGSSDMKIERDFWEVSLAGDWHYQEGNPDLPQRPLSLDPDDYPSLIFNGMLNPITGLQIAGANWYQGESDSGEPIIYRSKLIKLIDDWRLHWNIGDFPFIVVQLPFFRAASNQPSESSWATLRESQTFAQKRANTAIVGLIDTGDANDIHPDNKYTVGTRLAQTAKKLVYQQNLIASGPQYFYATISGNEIQVLFRDYGSPLISTNGSAALNGFAIAGEDGNFVWANASISANQTVTVSHPAISNPKYVRYAWADNPGTLNLFNAAGLPAIPFRTDRLATPWE